MKTDHNSILNHLILEVSVIAVFGEHIQHCNEEINSLAFPLAASIELCPLENNISANYEMFIKSCLNAVILLELGR